MGIEQYNRSYLFSHAAAFLQFQNRSARFPAHKRTAAFPFEGKLQDPLVRLTTAG
jgi:hypothetical protein